MRKLIVLVALSLSASAAWAQSSGAASVTKLPGEEKLSIRERAERDFLMPVRRKKAAELAKQQPTASAEQLATAAPENDALSTYNDAAPEPRSEEVAVAHEAHATRSRTTRHAAWLAARRERLAEARAAARRATRHSSKTKHTSKATKASARASKASKSKAHRREEAHRSTRKAAAKKASTHKAATAKHKATATKSKRHTAAAKTKTKTKPARHKRR